MIHSFEEMKALKPGQTGIVAVPAVGDLFRLLRSLQFVPDDAEKFMFITDRFMASAAKKSLGFSSAHIHIDCTGWKFGAPSRIDEKNNIYVPERNIDSLKGLISSAYDNKGPSFIVSDNVTLLMQFFGKEKTIEYLSWLFTVFPQSRHYVVIKEQFVEELLPELLGKVALVLHIRKKDDDFVVEHVFENGDVCEVVPFIIFDKKPSDSLATSFTTLAKEIQGRQKMTGTELLNSLNGTVVLSGDQTDRLLKYLVKLLVKMGKPVVFYSVKNYIENDFTSEEFNKITCGDISNLIFVEDDVLKKLQHVGVPIENWIIGKFPKVAVKDDAFICVQFSLFEKIYGPKTCLKLFEKLLKHFKNAHVRFLIVSDSIFEHEADHILRATQKEDKLDVVLDSRSHFLIDDVSK